MSPYSLADHVLVRVAVDPSRICLTCLVVARVREHVELRTNEVEKFVPALCMCRETPVGTHRGLTVGRGELMLFA